ncbi:hypothetical protein CYMTET_32892, partial [Cymbomonas tetramitiformis]
MPEAESLALQGMFLGAEVFFDLHNTTPRHPVGFRCADAFAERPAAQVSGTTKSLLFSSDGSPVKDTRDDRDATDDPFELIATAEGVAWWGGAQPRGGLGGEMERSRGVAWWEWSAAERAEGGGLVGKARTTLALHGAGMGDAISPWLAPCTRDPTVMGEGRNGRAQLVRLTPGGGCAAHRAHDSGTALFFSMSKVMRQVDAYPELVLKLLCACSEQVTGISRETFTRPNLASFRQHDEGNRPKRDWRDFDVKQDMDVAARQEQIRTVAAALSAAQRTGRYWHGLRGQEMDVLARVAAVREGFKAGEVVYERGQAGGGLTPGFVVVVARGSAWIVPPACNAAEAVARLDAEWTSHGGVCFDMARPVEAEAGGVLAERQSLSKRHETLQKMDRDAPLLGFGAARVLELLQSSASQTKPGGPDMSLPVEVKAGDLLGPAFYPMLLQAGVRIVAASTDLMVAALPLQHIEDASHHHPALKLLPITITRMVVGGAVLVKREYGGDMIMQERLPTKRVTKDKIHRLLLEAHKKPRALYTGLAAGVTNKDLLDLSGHIYISEFSAGQQLLRCGRHASCMLLVLQGEVERVFSHTHYKAHVPAPGSALADRARPTAGQLVGSAALLEAAVPVHLARGDVREWSLHASTDCTVAVLPISALPSLGADNPSLLYRMVRQAFSAELHRTSRLLHEHLHEELLKTAAIPGDGDASRVYEHIMQFAPPVHTVSADSRKGKAASPAVPQPQDGQSKQSGDPEMCRFLPSSKNRGATVCRTQYTLQPYQRRRMELREQMRSYPIPMRDRSAAEHLRSGATPTLPTLE